jgi:hypothetical protein
MPSLFQSFHPFHHNVKTSNARRSRRVRNRAALRAFEAAMTAAVSASDPLEHRALTELARRLATLSDRVESVPRWSRR